MLKPLCNCALPPFGCWQSREVQEKACFQESLSPTTGQLYRGASQGLSRGRTAAWELSGMLLCCLRGLGTLLLASGDGSLGLDRKRVLSQLGSGKSFCSAYTELCLPRTGCPS